jgi:protein-S-isoprenylcysteine O-methyltransferase Ste14
MPDTTTERARGAPPSLAVRLGEKLFRSRSATPIALVAVVLAWPTPGGLTAGRLAIAIALIAAGETYRFLAVGVAGKCTRTRGANVKELVTAGPFARMRNPLYVGNFVLTYGLVVLSKVEWLLWAFPAVFFAQYLLIVAWEEHVLTARFGEEYRRYRARVPAWWPAARPYPGGGHAFRRDVAMRSERDSLRAIVVLSALLIAKHVWFSGAVREAVRAALGVFGIR